MIMFIVVVYEDFLVFDFQCDNVVVNGDLWGFFEIFGRGIILMVLEEEFEELQDMVDELLNFDSNEG